MITMKQLEELESRVIKALQLIGDLRSENARFESENESLKAIAEEAKLGLEEKEQEIVRIQKELDEANRELSGLKDKEDELEKKIIELLGKMDSLKSGSAPITGSSASSRSAAYAKETPANRPKPSAASAGSPARAGKEELKIETIKEGEEVGLSDKDDDIIIIDEETSSGDTDVIVETDKGKPEGDDEIILLDEGSDEIVIDDIDQELSIIDESEVGSPKKKSKKKSDEFVDNDDDFLIIEDDKK